MDKQIAHFIEIGVCVIFAVVTLIMLMSAFRLQRDAAVANEKRQFFELTAENKNRYARYDSEQVGASELISIISQYAEEVEIYVDKTSVNNSSYCILADNRYIVTTRYKRNDPIMTSSLLGNIWDGYTLESLPKPLQNARQYGILSGIALGQIFYGNDKWMVYTIYDSNDVRSASSVGARGEQSIVTGFRIIKQ